MIVWILRRLQKSGVELLRCGQDNWLCGFWCILMMYFEQYNESEKWKVVFWMVLDEPICWLKMTLKIREKFVLGIQSAGYTHPLLFLCIIRYANIICFISVFTFRKSENKMFICKNLYKFITCKFAPNIFAYFFALPILTAFEPCKMCQDFSICVFVLSPFIS